MITSNKNLLESNVETIKKNVTEDKKIKDID